MFEILIFKKYLKLDYSKKLLKKNIIKNDPLLEFFFGMSKCVQ